MNRYAASVVQQVETTLGLSPYVSGAADPLEARLWFWETFGKAVAEAHERAYLATLDRP